MRPLGLSRQELWSAGPDRLSGGNGRAQRRCAWGSWGGPGRGRVQICCKGVPGREKRRMKARNINGSSREPRLDPGLCNRFGQTAPPRAPARTAAAAITPTPGQVRPAPSAPDGPAPSSARRAGREERRHRAGRARRRPGPAQDVARRPLMRMGSRRRRARRGAPRPAARAVVA